MKLNTKTERSWGFVVFFCESIIHNAGPISFLNIIDGILFVCGMLPRSQSATDVLYRLLVASALKQF